MCIWPAPGSRSCGAAAERGQCGMERSRLRSHEKLPPPAFGQGRGRGNGRAHRASTRVLMSCANERGRGSGRLGTAGTVSLGLCPRRGFVPPARGLCRGQSSEMGSSWGSQPEHSRCCPSPAQGPGGRRDSSPCPKPRPPSHGPHQPCHSGRYATERVPGGSVAMVAG